MKCTNPPLRLYQPGPCPCRDLSNGDTMLAALQQGVGGHIGLLERQVRTNGVVEGCGKLSMEHWSQHIILGAQGRQPSLPTKHESHRTSLRLPGIGVESTGDGM
ncbi:hypothetical protein PV04_08528 [Phialophora macrospora]|uniref:Uncharacterized protein n=1 Tax=Phialophora macrospora TaxID=1851006 RepID=A0A0D2FU07_9EURO|nr:hypothetical protein PV04_08528 [Phialophora macrospora]